MMKDIQLSISRYCIIRKPGIVSSSGFSLSNTSDSLEGFLLKAYEVLQLNYPRFYKTDHLSQLGLLASHVLLGDFNLHPKYDAESVAVVLSNASASLDTDMRYQDSTKSIPSPSLFVYTLPNIVAGEICIRYGIKGENAFFVSAQFDPVVMADYVEMVMAEPGTALCVAGWIEVLEEHFDVFLYLVEKSTSGQHVLHSREELARLYMLNVWNS
jgi:hypothetical protein